MRYSNNGNYIVLVSKKIWNAFYILEYKSVKLEIDEGLIKGDNRIDEACKDGYRSCGKFNKG